jgi:hypothetical protein
MATTSTSVSHDFRLNQLSYARHSSNINSLATCDLRFGSNSASYDMRLLAASQRHATSAVRQRFSNMRPAPSGFILATGVFRLRGSCIISNSAACDQQQQRLILRPCAVSVTHGFSV